MENYSKKDLASKISELSKVVAEKENDSKKKVSKTQAEYIIDLYGDAVRELVSGEGDKLTIQKLFVIEKYMAKPRKANNLQTGEVMEIPARVRTKIRAKF